MAITTYAELKTAVGKWLARSADTQITGNVDDFVTLATAYFNRVLRVRQMETTQSFTTTGGSTNLADGYLAWRRLLWLGTPYVSLQYMAPDAFNVRHSSTDPGVPQNFTIEGSNISIRPTDDSTTYDFLYYSKIPSLVDADDSNWVLSSHPDLYLAASMAEAHAFLMDAEHAGLWMQKRDAIIDDLKKLSEKTKGPSQMIPIGTFY